MVARHLHKHWSKQMLEATSAAQALLHVAIQDSSFCIFNDTGLDLYVLQY